jgi:hypothetical protein
MYICNWTLNRDESAQNNLRVSVLSNTRFQASASVYIRPSLFWNVVQCKLALSYRRFGSTYRSHLQGSTLKMRPIHWPKTSVTDYQSTKRNIPEELRSLRYLYRRSILRLDRWYFSFLLTKTIWGLTSVGSERPGRLWDSLSLLFNV